MKKKIAVIFSLVLIVGLLGVGVYKSSASGKMPTLTTEEIRQLVSSQYPGEITEIELDRDNNRMIYEVEVENDNKEYDLKLDGNTGEILELKEKTIYQPKQATESEADVADTNDTVKEEPQQEKQTEAKVTTNDPTVIESKQKESTEVKEQAAPKEKPEPQPKKQTKTEQKQSNKNTVISEARAIEIAKKEFPGTVVDFELDEDDGRLIYEIEIENGDEEAEFEIDAYSGKILVIDIDD